MPKTIGLIEDGIILTRIGSFNLKNPNPADVHLESMVEVLARKGRYSCQIHFPVLNHLLLCDWLATHYRYTTEMKLEVLTHDLHEAYCGDPATPMKELIPEYRPVEDKIEACVRSALGVSNLHYDFVKWVDRISARSEMEHFFVNNPLIEKVYWGDVPHVPMPHMFLPTVCEEDELIDTYLKKFYDYKEDLCE